MSRTVRLRRARPAGVVWFGEQLLGNELERVEDFLDGGACDVVIVAGTTATFGYIIDWALRGSRDGAELIEVNPEETRSHDSRRSWCGSLLRSPCRELWMSCWILDAASCSHGPVSHLLSSPMRPATGRWLQAIRPND